MLWTAHALRLKRAAQTAGIQRRNRTSLGMEWFAQFFAKFTPSCDTCDSCDHVQAFGSELSSHVRLRYLIMSESMSFHSKTRGMFDTLMNSFVSKATYIRVSYQCVRNNRSHPQSKKQKHANKAQARSPDGQGQFLSRPGTSTGNDFLYCSIWVWVKIRYPNNWMVNTKLDIHICGPINGLPFWPTSIL